MLAKIQPNGVVLKRANVTRKEFSMTEKDFTSRIDGLINDYEGGESNSKELRDGILDTLIELVSKVSPFEARVSPACEKSCKKCSCFEMHSEERLKNFCSMWCIKLTDLHSWNIDKDYCSRYVSKSV